MSVMCLVCVLFHGSLYPLFPFYEIFSSLVELHTWINSTSTAIYLTPAK